MPEQNEHTHKDENVTIVVHNEDSGRNIPLKGRKGDTVQAFIDKLYEALKTTRKPDDRLRCESSGQDVFQFASLNIEDYLRHDCHSHEWLFAGGTGGA